MIDVVLRIEGISKTQEFKNLTLKELGETLVGFSKEYMLVFDTVRDIVTQTSCTLYITAIPRSNA